MYCNKNFSKFNLFRRFFGPYWYTNRVNNLRNTSQTTARFLLELPRNLRLKFQCENKAEPKYGNRKSTQANTSIDSFYCIGDVSSGTINNHCTF